MLITSLTEFRIKFQLFILGEVFVIWLLPTFLTPLLLPTMIWTLVCSSFLQHAKHFPVYQGLYTRCSLCLECLCPQFLHAVFSSNMFQLTLPSPPSSLPSLASPPALWPPSSSLTGIKYLLNNNNNSSELRYSIVYVLTFNLHIKFMRWVKLSSSLYKWGIRDTGRSSDLFKVTQLGQN